MLADAGAYTQKPNSTVRLSGRDSTGDGLRYLWKQVCPGECRNPIIISGANGATPSFRAPSVTRPQVISLEIKLTVTDRYGYEGSHLVYMQIEDLSPETFRVPPQAYAVVNYPADPIDTDLGHVTEAARENTRVTLDGTGSSDTLDNGRIVTYLWEQIGPTGGTLTNANRSRATFLTPTGLAVYTVYSFRLTVTDNNGETDTHEVKVRVRAQPTSYIELALDVYDANGNLLTWNAGKEIPMRGTLRGYSGELLGYTWSFTSNPTGTGANDASWSTQEGIETGPSAQVTTKFTLPCLASETRFTFRLSVLDSISPTVVSTQGLRVIANSDSCSVGAGGNGGPDPSPPPEPQAEVSPSADAGPDLSGAPGDSVTLQGTNSVNPYGEWWRMAHRWTQLSGPTVTLTHPQTFQPAANFGDPMFTIPANAADGTTLEFRLTVTDQEGESDSDTMVVTVIAPTSTGESGEPPPLRTESEPTQVTSCITGLGRLAGAVEFSGAWDDAGCRAHHRADSPARYVHFTVSENTGVTITLTSARGGALFVSKGTPQNGWGTPPGATYEHRVNVRRNNGKLAHDGSNSVTLTLAPGETYTVEAASTSGGGGFTLSIRAD